MRNTLLIVALAAGLAYVLFHQRDVEPDAVPAAAVPESTASLYAANDEAEREAPEETALRPTFGGYPCADDCAVHVAGFEWAEQHAISDPDDCDGATGAFIEGCRVYAESRGEDEATAALDARLYIAQR